MNDLGLLALGCLGSGGRSMESAGQYDGNREAPTQRQFIHFPDLLAGYEMYLMKHAQGIIQSNKKYQPWWRQLVRFFLKKVCRIFSDSLSLYDVRMSRILAIAISCLIGAPMRPLPVKHLYSRFLA